MKKNKADKYKWGLFYFDPKDPRIIVPKGHAWSGWTLNFGNRFSYFVLSVLVALIVLIHYFVKS